MANKRNGVDTYNGTRALLRPNNLYKFAMDIYKNVDQETAALRTKSGLSADQLLDHPDFAGALISVMYREMARSAPRALNVMNHLLSSKNEKIQFAAAKFILDKTTPDVRSGDPANDKEALDSMNIDQLHELVDRLESELSGRAKPVSAPKELKKEHKSLDFMQ